MIAIPPVDRKPRAAFGRLQPPAFQVEAVVAGERPERRLGVGAAV